MQDDWIAHNSKAVEHLLTGFRKDGLALIQMCDGQHDLGIYNPGGFLFLGIHKQLCLFT